MNINDALRILAALRARKALFISDTDIFAANDAFIDAGDYANAAEVQRLAHLHPSN
jgi:hypothetical protein